MFDTDQHITADPGAFNVALGLAPLHDPATPVTIGGAAKVSDDPQHQVSRATL